MYPLVSAVGLDVLKGQVEKEPEEAVAVQSSLICAEDLKTFVGKPSCVPIHYTDGNFTPATSPTILFQEHNAAGLETVPGCLHLGRHIGKGKCQDGEACHLTQPCSALWYQGAACRGGHLARLWCIW